MGRYYCNKCKKTISEKVYEYSMDQFGRALCIEHQGGSKGRSKSNAIYQRKSKAKSRLAVTPQARKLYYALKKRGIKCKLEDYDGYKHIDISIDWAGLNLEIDGKHHLLNSRQLYADLERDFWSQEEGKLTIRIPNDRIDKDVDGLANSIARVARKRYRNGNY